MLFHLGYTLLDASRNSGLSASFFDVLSMTALVIVSVSLATAFRFPVGSLLPPIFVIAASSLALAAGSHERAPIQAESGGMLAHIICAIVGYSLLSIAALQAIALQLSERALKQHNTGGALRQMPPLETMETLLFQFIFAGWITLGLSIGFGAIYIEDLLGQYLAHKTVFSLASWALFGLLLFGRWRWGWRGATAVKWTLTAFICLLLGYFGSKFVLQIVLGR